MKDQVLKDKSNRIIGKIKNNKEIGKGNLLTTLL